MTESARARRRARYRYFCNEVKKKIHEKVKFLNFEWIGLKFKIFGFHSLFWLIYIIWIENKGTFLM